MFRIRSLILNSDLEEKTLANWETDPFCKNNDSAVVKKIFKLSGSLDPDPYRF